VVLRPVLHSMDSLLLYFDHEEALKR